MVVQKAERQQKGGEGVSMDKSRQSRDCRRMCSSLLTFREGLYSSFPCGDGVMNDLN